MKETILKHPECPTCVCGLTELTWSDRGAHVNYEDAEQVADMVVSCALDHQCDRGDGVPWGMQDGEEAVIRPIVARHLAAVCPDWLHRSVSMNAEQRAAFMRDLVAALQAARNR